MVAKTVNLAIFLALILAMVAAIIGIAAVLASGYTAGAYVHDLALLILGLAVLSLAETGNIGVITGRLPGVKRATDPGDPAPPTT